METNQWLSQVSKDILLKTLAELNKTIAADLHYPAISIYDAKQASYESIVSNDNDWEIGYHIHVSDFVEANDIALLALQNGVNVLSFYLDRLPSDEEFKSWTRGIEFNWIQTFIYCSNMIQPLLRDNLMKQFQQHYSNLEDSKIFIFSNEDNETFYEFPNLMHDEVDYQTWANLLSKFMFNFPLRQSVSRIPILFKIKDHALWNSVQIRSLRLLINRLCEVNNFSKDQFALHIFIDEKIHQEDPHQNMIAMSSAGLSAAIAGLDYLYITPSALFHRDPIWVLTAIQSQFILKHESKLDQVIDPLHGAHAIENMTDQLCQKIWKLLQQISN